MISIYQAAALALPLIRFLPAARAQASMTAAVAISETAFPAGGVTVQSACRNGCVLPARWNP